MDLESLMLLVVAAWCRKEVKIMAQFIISQKKKRMLNVQQWGLGASVRNSTRQ